MGELFIKFGSQWNVYTNFFNNYPVVLETIEKVSDSLSTEASVRPPELDGRFGPNPKDAVIGRTSSLLLLPGSPLVHRGLFEVLFLLELFSVGASPQQGPGPGGWTELVLKVADVPHGVVTGKHVMTR